MWSVAVFSFSAIALVNWAVVVATASAALSSMQSRPQLFSTLCRLQLRNSCVAVTLPNATSRASSSIYTKKRLPLFLRCMDMEIMTPKTVEMRADELRATSTARSMLRSILPLILRAEGISATLRTIMPLSFNCGDIVLYAALKISLEDGMLLGSR